MPIEARNLPARHALTEEVPKNAKVRLRGAGRSLFKTIILKNFISDFKLVLDLERISEEYDFILNDYFERYPQKIVIPSSFEVDYVEVVYPNAIHISLDEYKESISERIISEIPVQIINENDALQVFVSPQTVSLTVIGGTDYIASLKPNDIYISVDFNNWKSQKQFYELQVNVPKDVMKWMDLSPRNIELIVTRK